MPTPASARPIRKAAHRRAVSEPSAAPAPSLVDRLAGVLEHTAVRPSWDEYFMATALLIASRSACGRLHVGCVLVSGGEHANRIVAAGYNGFL
ncbi:MAG: hypothetical protein Q7V01_14110, partial [Vicinamibacterales bacterium]|nr:hypothetical protein [Vicinamibacterales bacterium]